MKPLSLIPNQEDLDLHRLNSCPDLISRRLRELVPLLEFVDCIVEEVSAERTTLSIPLLASSMNQNGTHQASVFYLIADYALGISMFAALPGVYVTGVHDRCNALPVQYWLKRGHVKHLAPGTGNLSVVAHISPQDALNIRVQLIEKGRCELSGTVHIYQDGNLVAEAYHTMGLYVDLHRSKGIKANIFQVQNLITTSLLIAGLRTDMLSRQIAQGQGRALAQRITKSIPQLPSLVQARTLHLENYIQANGHQFGQILVLGVGLDPKPITFARSNLHWFGVDLRDMLREREVRFNRINTKATNFTPVATDLRLDTWDRSLLEAGFSPYLPTLVIIEGLVMHLPHDELTLLLQKLHSLNSFPDSRLWLDHFTSSLFRLDVFEVKSFISSMTRLVEPLALGLDDPSGLLPDAWTTLESVSSEAVLNVSDAMHREYHFSILQPKQVLKEST